LSGKSAADMEGPERNRRGMQQRSGLVTTISDPGSAASRFAWCEGTIFAVPVSAG